MFASKIKVKDIIHHIPKDNYYLVTNKVRLKLHTGEWVDGLEYVQLGTGCPYKFVRPLDLFQNFEISNNKAYSAEVGIWIKIKCKLRGFWQCLKK